MVQTKKMDESAFANIVKEFNAFGELIRAKQDEKQAIIDEFDSESKRFFLGKISERTLESSVRKTNKEMQKLDDGIRTAIKSAGDLAGQARKFASSQSPRSFKATLSGVVRTGQTKPRRRVKKRIRKKPSVKKKSPVKSKKKTTVKKKK